MARHADPNAQRRALHHFLDRYQHPLLTHLRARHRLNDHDAADVLQGFITDKIIERRLLTHAVRGRGRFRAFLLTTLDNFVTDDRRRARTRRRLLEASYDERNRMDDPVATFELAWARQVLTESVRRTAAECERTKRGDIWAVFDGRVLRECLHHEPPTPYEDIVAQLRLANASQAMNLLVTGKRLFARMLRDVVAEYGSDDDDIRSELQDLRTILARTTSASFSL